MRLNSVNYIILDEIDSCLSDIKIKNDLHVLLSRKLSNTYKSAETIEQEFPENLVYSNLANTREFEASMETLRHHRQTILCSATIPQRFFHFNSKLRVKFINVLFI